MVQNTARKVKELWEKYYPGTLEQFADWVKKMIWKKRGK